MDYNLFSDETINLLIKHQIKFILDKVDNTRASTHLIYDIKLKKHVHKQSIKNGDQWINVIYLTTYNDSGSNYSDWKSEGIMFN